MDEKLGFDKTINCYCIDETNPDLLGKIEKIGRVFGIYSTGIMMMEEKGNYQMTVRFEGNPLEYSKIQCDLEHSLRNDIRLIFFVEKTRDSLEKLREYFEMRNPGYMFVELRQEPFELMCQRYQQ